MKDKLTEPELTSACLVVENAMQNSFQSCTHFRAGWEIERNRSQQSLSYYKRLAVSEVVFCCLTDCKLTKRHQSGGNVKVGEGVRYQASLGAPDTSVEFQRVNSRICVAMMVFAPIYVAQMISSYLRNPENKTGAFGWVKSWKRQITKNTTWKPRKWQWRPLANEVRIKLTH